MFLSYFKQHTDDAFTLTYPSGNYLQNNKQKIFSELDKFAHHEIVTALFLYKKVSNNLNVLVSAGDAQYGLCGNDANHRLDLLSEYVAKNSTTLISFIPGWHNYIL